MPQKLLETLKKLFLWVLFRTNYELTGKLLKCWQVVGSDFLNLLGAPSVSLCD